jgi:hypothetical protein
MGFVHHRPVHIVLRCKLGLERGLAAVGVVELRILQLEKGIGRDFLDAAFFYQLFDVEALAAARTFPHPFDAVKHLGESNFVSSGNHSLFSHKPPEDHPTEQLVSTRL